MSREDLVALLSLGAAASLGESSKKPKRPMRKTFPYVVVVLFLVTVFSVWGYQQVSEWRADRQPPAVEYADDPALTHVEDSPEKPDGKSVSAEEATLTPQQADDTAAVVEDGGGKQEDRGFLRGVYDWWKKMNHFK